MFFCCSCTVARADLLPHYCSLCSSLFLRYRHVALALSLSLPLTLALALALALALVRQKLQPSSGDVIHNQKLRVSVFTQVGKH